MNNLFFFRNFRMGALYTRGEEPIYYHGQLNVGLSLASRKNRSFNPTF